MTIALWIIFSILIGLVGKDKSTGFAGALILSLLLSPIIGLIIVLVSKDKVSS